MTTGLTSQRFTAPDSFEAINDFLYQRGLTDGLPVVPPTEDRVQRMLEGTSRKANEVLGVFLPKWGELTIEKLAINAVMAGCEPRYMPLLIAAMEAFLARGHFYTSQTTTHPGAPLLIINGPVRKELDINCQSGAFGPGKKANASIGRTVRLVLMNVGGNIPGVTDMSTQGGPHKYSYCIGENEEASPWSPLHVDLGHPATSSTVSVVGAEMPHNINDHDHARGAEILTVAADTMGTLGSNLMAGMGGILLILCPEHATTIAADGFSKDDVKRFLFENARMPLRKKRLFGMYSFRRWPLWWESPDEDMMLPLVRDWQDILVIVVGGVGKHSSCIPGPGASAVSTRVIQS